MKKSSVTLFVFAVAAGFSSAAAEVPFRPPAVPLAVNDPYFSLWSPSDRLTDTETMHWSRDAQPLSVLGEVAGKTWRFCGSEPSSVPAARQLSLEVGCTETVYRFDAGGTPVELRFSTPVIPGEWDVFSRPVTYLTVKGAKAKVTVSPAFATDDDSAAMVTNRRTIAGCPAISIGRKEQRPHRPGDRVRPDSGYVWLVDAGDRFLIAYDSVTDIRFLGREAPAWWRRLPRPFETRFHWMLDQAVRDYPRLMREMAAFDVRMRRRFAEVGGEKYAEMAALAWRQSFGACRLATAENGDMLFFSKENSSNGCIGTVDILYPQMPHLMLAGVELLKAAIRPDMLYAVSGRWPYPYAPHDLGRFPVADGQDYGMKAGKTDADRMPVEECGNLIIALYAVARMEGHTDFADIWWPTVRRWAEYLRTFGFDPENQLCTDDFAGHLAHNANLSVKSIVAFEAFARLSAMRGDAAAAREFHALAVDGAAKWAERASGGKDGASCLAFGMKGTWSLKYNLAFARALGIDLFPADIVRREVAAYIANRDRYGTPLDNRTHWCKVDWLFWCAALAENRADFTALTDPVHEFLQTTRDRVPFPDLYYTETAKCTRYGKGADQFIGFNSRPVIGGIYLPVLGTVPAATAVRARWSDDPVWIRVAAADSRDAAKASADLVCTGTNDECVINRALRRCKDTGKQLQLFSGLYNLDAVRGFGDGGPRTAIRIPNMKRPFKMTSDRPQGAILRLRPSAMPADRSESVDAVRGEWTWRGIVNKSRLDLSNMMVYMPDPMRPCRAIDLRRVMSVEMSNVRAVAFGEAVLRGASYPYDLHTPPHEECIGITMTDGSNSVPANYVNVRALGFGQGIQVGGEHVVMINCCAAFGRYGFTFGNYPYYCAFNHPITMINCCDEQNVNLPLFASCGDNGGAIHGGQEVTMISFNCERVESRVPGGRLGSAMRETRPGTWRGQIGFTIQPKWGRANAVDAPIWEHDGSGSGFRTVNNAHKTACPSVERRTYAPQHYQTLFDTDLKKLLICTDPSTRTWVDAMGVRVE